MSTILEQLREKLIGMSLKSFMASIIAVLFWAGGSFAQCGFTENGYYFLHPRFNNVNWMATIYQTDLIPVETMCSEKPLLVATGSLSSRGTFIYLTPGKKWMITNGPLVNTTCSPTIEFSTPAQIAVPDLLGLNAGLPVHIMSRGSSDRDTVYFVAAGAANAVYCLHVNTANGAVGTVDTLRVALNGSQSINGVWGERTVAGVDTALWLAGGGGALFLVPFRNSSWGEAASLDFDGSESITAIGGGFVGTASGKIYARSGNTFTLSNSSVSSPIRRLSKRIAVGDSGTLLVCPDKVWISYTSDKSSNYCYGNLTATAGGTAVELIDDGWRYTSRVLWDSASTISSVSPSEFGECREGCVYSESEEIKITVTIGDIDDNRSLPAVTLTTAVDGVTSTVLDKDQDNTTLQRHDPSAVCVDSKAWFADSVVEFTLSNSTVEFVTNAQRGYFNPSCGIWQWQPFVFSSTVSWNRDDLLTVRVGEDVMRIVNNAGSTRISYNGKNSVAQRFGAPLTLHCAQRRVYLSAGVGSDIRLCTITDAAGRLVWRHSGASLSCGEKIISAPLPVGIHILCIEHKSGASEIRRVVITGR